MASAVGKSTAKLPKKKKDGFFKELVRNKIMFVMLIPMAVYFVINSYMPMFGIYMAFTRFDFLGGIFGSPFVGFKNFEFLFASGKLWELTVNTLSYNIMFMIVDHFLQISFAIMLSRLANKVFTKISQSLMFLPYFVSFVILNAIVYNVFKYEVGFLNNMLRAFGAEPVDMYANAPAWRYILLALNVWKGIGYGTVIYLATITGISTELYEAADIDGANVFQQIRYITLPLLLPTFMILMLMALGRMFRGQLELFYQTIGNVGTLFKVTDILDTYIYRSMRGANFNVGQTTAAGLYQSVFGLALILTVNGLIRKFANEYALF